MTRFIFVTLALLMITVPAACTNDRPAQTAKSTADVPTCFGKQATIVGTDDSETIHGTRGPDVIVSGRGGDKVYGEGGDDLICSGSGRFTNYLYGGTGDDKLEGGGGYDTLFGDAGDDLLYGRGFPDFLVGGPGNDAEYGGSSPDTFRDGPGDDVMVGGPDDEVDPSNLVVYSDSPGPVRIDLRADTATGNGDDIVRHIWQAIGSPYNDVIRGTPRGDVLSGGCGDDRLYGRGGRDDLFGRAQFGLHPKGRYGEPCDRSTQTDNDIVYGGGGDDIFRGDAYEFIGTDKFYGGAGFDIYDVFGGRGDFDGGSGIDLVYARYMPRSLHVDLAAGMYRIGHHRGTLRSVNGVEGSNLDDTIFGSSGADVLMGFDGDDTIRGRGGDDFLRGDWPDLQKESYRDTVVGGSGMDNCRAEVARSCETSRHEDNAFGL